MPVASITETYNAVGALRALKATDPTRFESTYGHVFEGLTIDDELRYDLGDASHPADGAGPLGPAVINVAALDAQTTAQVAALLPFHLHPQ